MTQDAASSPGDRSGTGPLLPLLALLGTAAVLIVLAWSPYPGDYDPINFAAALSRYEIASDSPHPPGYPLFVGLARGAALLVGRWRAYQLVNLVLVLLASTLLWALGSRLGSPRAGLLAAGLLATHPLVLASAATPESYLSDAFFATLLATLPSLSRAPGTGAALGTAAAFTACALFRPVSVAMLGPLGGAALFVALQRSEGRAAALRKTALACGLGVLGSAGAYAFTVHLGGGAAAYRAATARVMGAAFRGASVLGGAPLSSHLSMAARCLGWFAALAAPPLLLAALLAARRNGSLRRAVPLPALAVGLAWLLPPLGFYLVVYYLKPVYHLITLPALVLAFAWLAAEGLFARRARAAAVVTALLAAAQLAFFWVPVPRLPAPLFRLTRASFAARERAWAAVERGLEGVDWDADLVVFRRHPDVHPLSPRLLSGGKTFGIASETGEVRYFGRFWLEVPEADRRTVPERYRRLLVIDASAPSGPVVAIDLATAGTRDFATLLCR